MSSPKIVNSNISYWANRWAENRIGWHQNSVDKFLVKYYPDITGKVLETFDFQENSKTTWFVPLCGKTKDIPYLLSLGHKVVAVEGVRSAIDTLDQENDLKLSFNEEKSLFIGAEGRLKIYFGDLFNCPIEDFGAFDYVWDRGSLIAVEYDCRMAYIELMKRALKGVDFKYLLEGVRYDKSGFGGPPRSVYESDIEDLYGDWTEIKFLEKVPFPEDHPVRTNPGVGDVDEVIYMFTPKQ